MVTGKLFHKSTIRLKNKNLKTSVLRRPFKTRGVLPEGLGGGVRRASGNPYPISDQEMSFSLPYSRPDPKFDTLFQTRR